MKLKRFLTFTMTAALGLSLLTGCGSSSSSSSSSDADTSAEVSSEAASEDTSSEDSEEVTTVSEGVLTMATNAYFPPYEYYEGSEIVGIDAEIAAAIADKLGLELQIEDMEFDSIITAIQTGKADIGLAGMTVTEERLQSINFSDSYATGIQSVIVSEDSDIETIDDLAGKKIGVQLSTTGDIYATDDFGSDYVEQYNKGNDAVLALVQGKIDAVIIDNQPAISYVAANEGLKILDTQYAEEEYAACISKDNEGLLDAVNAALAELEEEGTLQEILDKYIVAE
ncbi:MAG: transporter substrate-binding domain-containing protein [Clostridiales bacterium]|nr:transporter substrate-binding domain-containing protein [Clostridiales bacterium]